jgi:hypothetical protein
LNLILANIESRLLIYFELKGVETWVSIFPNGFQMEHISHKDPSSISCLFFYPIRSLIYCGALRFINNNYDEKNPNSWCFIPLDSDLARLPENQQNPPLFVIFLKAIDPITKKTITECHVFVTGIVKTAMKLVEYCQEAYSLNKTSVNEFFKLHGNLPVVYCMKEELNGSHNKRVVVKQYDLNGYFYATDGSLIDSWQLFDSSNMIYGSMLSKISANKKFTFDNIYSNSRLTNPYEQTENLVRVDKRVDPITGQNIYVRWLSDTNSKASHQPDTYDINSLIYNDEKLSGEEQPRTPSHKPSVMVKEARTPSPIIVEKVIKKKSPQIIVKEIHLHEPAPPPIKVVQTLNGNGNLPYVSHTSPVYAPNKIKPRVSNVSGYPIYSQIPMYGRNQIHSSNIVQGVPTAPKTPYLFPSQPQYFSNVATNSRISDQVYDPNMMPKPYNTNNLYGNYFYGQPSSKNIDSSKFYPQKQPIYRTNIATGPYSYLNNNINYSDRTSAYRSDRDRVYDDYSRIDPYIGNPRSKNKNQNNIKITFLKP